MHAKILRPLVWVASTRKDLQSMPAHVQDAFGYALHLAQVGRKSDSAKPLQGFGSAGVLEVCEDFDGDTYRAIYTVRFTEAVYVLHCFQKKSRQGTETPRPDMEKIRDRFKAAAARSASGAKS